MKSLPLSIALNEGKSKTVSAIPVSETLSGFRFFTHIDHTGTSHVVIASEWRTGIHCCSAPTRVEVIKKLKEIYDEYGDHAFAERIRKAYGEYPALNAVNEKINQ